MFLIWIWQLNGLFTSVNKANEISNHYLPGLTFHTLCICATSLHCGWAYGSSEFHFDQLFLIIGTRVGLLSSVHKQASAQGSSYAEWLFALCSSTVWLFSTVDEYVPLQFSSLCEWLFSLCTVWMTIWVLWFRAWLNYFLHSVHLCGFSPLKVSMCRIMWLQISCICLYSLQCVFCCDISWATVPVEKLSWVHLWALGIEEDKTGSGWPFMGRKLGLYIALGTALEKKRQRSSVRGCRRTCSMKLCSCLT